MNVLCHNEYVQAYTIFHDTSTIDDSSTCYQLFVGTKSLVSDVYGMKTDKHFSIIWKMASNIHPNSYLD